MNPKIGTYTSQGTEYPTETITGKPFVQGDYDPPPAIVHGLLEGHFAIGDVFPPPGFDVNAEIAKLNAEIAPKRVVKVEEKP